MPTTLTLSSLALDRDDHTRATSIQTNQGVEYRVEHLSGDTFALVSVLDELRDRVAELESGGRSRRSVRRAEFTGDGRCFLGSGDSTMHAAARAYADWRYAGGDAAYVARINDERSREAAWRRISGRDEREGALSWSPLPGGALPGGAADLPGAVAVAS